MMLLFMAVMAASASPDPGAGAGPCDIYGATGTPCVAAYSVIRALYRTYTGPLYRVRRGSDNATMAIDVSAGGFADAAAQDEFCAASACTINRMFDQSPRGNHLDTASKRRSFDQEVNASRAPLTVRGHPVYAAFFEGRMGYRNDQTSGLATGDQPESLYMVTSGVHYNGACCFDFGNAETSPGDAGPGTMEAISITNGTWGMSHHGLGSGPWVMADLENGLFGSNQSASLEPPMLGLRYVTAMVKGDSGNHWAIKGGDATSGRLKTLYDGVRPCTVPNPKHEADCKHPPNYSPMRKQGGIILGIGGDNSGGGVGTFYEGVITAGYSTNAADDAVQANIVAAGYGR